MPLRIFAKFGKMQKNQSRFRIVFRGTVDFRIVQMLGERVAASVAMRVGIREVDQPRGGIAFHCISDSSCMFSDS